MANFRATEHRLIELTRRHASPFPLAPQGFQRQLQVRLQKHKDTWRRHERMQKVYAKRVSTYTRHVTPSAASSVILIFDHITAALTFTSQRVIAIVKVFIKLTLSHFSSPHIIRRQLLDQSRPCGCGVPFSSTKQSKGGLPTVRTIIG